MSKDSGDWLSAQQAVQPDGTVVENLPLVNKKLPPLVNPQYEQTVAVELPVTGVRALMAVLGQLPDEDLRKFLSSDVEVQAALSTVRTLQAALDNC